MGAIARHSHSLCWKEAIAVLSSIERSLGREEGTGDQQMTPELSNEAISAKATQLKPWKHYEAPYDTFSSTYKRGM